MAPSLSSGLYSKTCPGTPSPHLSATLFSAYNFLMYNILMYSSSRLMWKGRVFGLSADVFWHLEKCLTTAQR